MKPTIGRIVLISLSLAMCEEINRRRTNSVKIKEQIDAGKWSIGAQAHIGNEVREGDKYPMIVTAVWSEQCINGQVILDGNDQYWVTSANQGDQHGQWNWPPREN